MLIAASIEVVSQPDIDVIARPAANGVDVEHKEGLMEQKCTVQWLYTLVPKEGLEPSCLATHAPETCVSTNSTTSVLNLTIKDQIPKGIWEWCPGQDSNLHTG